MRSDVVAVEDMIQDTLHSEISETVIMPAINQKLNLFVIDSFS